MKDVLMKVILVALNPDQIEKAKEINGSGKKITHAVLCGRYGQIFGTEKQCRKYYSAWSRIFPNIFDGGEEREGYEPSSYESTFDLVNILISENDNRQ
jgi:hypothetical protein